MDKRRNHETTNNHNVKSHDKRNNTSNTDTEYIPLDSHSTDHANIASSEQYQAAGDKKMRHNNGKGGAHEDTDSFTQRTKPHATSVVVVGAGDDVDKHTASADLLFSRSNTKKCLCILAMTVAITLVALLVALFAITLTNRSDKVIINGPTVEHITNFFLFSTKTTYTRAIEYLTSKSKPADLPDYFAASDSLESIHRRLTGAPNNCKLIRFYYFSRHAARYPGKVEYLLDAIRNVQARIELPSLDTDGTSQPLLQDNVASPNDSSSFNDKQQADIQVTPVVVQSDQSLANYKNWQTFMVETQDNLVLKTGALETRETAKRLKSIFPDLFSNGAENRINVKTTEATRTAQTAIEFMKEFDKFMTGTCPIDQYPIEDQYSNMSQAKTVRDNQCYKSLIEQTLYEDLDFHKICENKPKTSMAPKVDLHVNLNDSQALINIAKSVSNKLRLTKESDKLTVHEVKKIAELCSYETAYQGSSTWCNLFTEEELKFIDYLHDIEYYYLQAYGHQYQAKSACMLSIPTIKSGLQAVKDDTTGDLLKYSEANFYFTHSEVLRKMLAALIDLTKDKGYTPEIIQAHVNAGTVPDKREFRSSLMTPFSANIAFNFYKCPKTTIQGMETLTRPIRGTNFKVVASINERAITMSDCPSQVCEYNQFIEKSRFLSEKDCNVNELCSVDYSQII